nr:MAG TPA: hypothetical protein [Bacteriophage sp.]
MKRVINDLLYDTDTADLIFIEEDTNRKLYKTPNGNFFTLYPTGEIRAKTEEATKDYLGRYDVEKYIEVFGEPREA